MIGKPVSEADAAGPLANGASVNRPDANAAAVTVAVASLPSDLTTAAPDPTGVVCLVRGGDGVVGWGVHASFAASGPDAAERIADWFDGVRTRLEVSDEVGVTGTGPIAFVSLGFDHTDTSVAVVPAVVIGRSRGVCFRTTIGPTAEAVEPSPIGSPGQVSWSDASLPVAGYIDAVAAATALIRAGELGKVVLAHDLAAVTERPVDHRFLLGRLAAAYPSCWTFAVDGLIGASPEMLIRRSGDRVTSRVLAGTGWPHHAGDAVAGDLLASSKNRSEHEFAVRSVADALAPVTTTLTVPSAPRPLTLANLTHLATDISGRLGPDRPSALQLAARLHPPAAVGGTPTDAAMAVIRRLEPAPRGRYAAPVGWIDAAGDGVFAIALRCAEVSGTSVRLLAGCGIVADSDPESEASEAQIKMIPIRDALEARNGALPLATPVAAARYDRDDR